MLEKFMQEHVAVSSLESPLHAKRKNPRIITVTWFIGKRCNYDCSYCPSYIHDNYSPHVDKQDCLEFIDQLEKHAVAQNKELKVSITGGEPFVHPNFFEILDYLKKVKSLTQLTVTTNGSLPLDTYKKSADYLTNLTVSLHLEQAQDVIDSTVEKILTLNRIPGLFFSVNLMAVPDKFRIVERIIDVFKSNKVKFILRKIDPPFDGLNTKISKGDVEQIKQEQERFIEQKMHKKSLWQKDIDKRQQYYYSKEELLFLEKFEDVDQWQNIKLHTPSDSIEKNTDELKSKNLNSWEGWKCFIGVDSLYIQHDGTVFRGNCLQGKALGKLGQTIDWPKKPVTCAIKWCTCNADMVVRKVKDKQYENIIND